MSLLYIIAFRALIIIFIIIKTITSVISVIFNYRRVVNHCAN